MKVDLRIHPSMRFSCTQCGHCCRGWAIPFTDEEQARLAREDWGRRFPDLAGRTLWERVPGGAGGMGWRMRLREDGACPFLGERNQCRIHEAFGAHAKPLTCRTFPYTYAATPAGTFVGLRFNCPGVIEGRGACVTEDAGELAGAFREISRQAALPAYPATVPIGARGRLEWQDLHAIEDALLQLIGDASIPFARRLLVMLRLAEVFQEARMEALGGDRLRQMLAMVLPDLRSREGDAGWEGATLGGAERVMFHQFLAIVHTREYAAFAQRPWTERLRVRLRATGNGYRFLFGHGRVPVAGEPGFVDIDRAWGVPAPLVEGSVTELLERWVRVKLWAKASFSRLFFDLGYDEGIGILGATIAAVSWWARAFAAARGAGAAAPEDWRRGLYYVDGALSGMRRASFYHRLVFRSVGKPVVAQRLVRWLAAPPESVPATA